MPRSLRYHLILLLVGLGTSLAAVAGWRFAKSSAPVSGPIVLIALDPLRAADLPAYGSDRVAMPALDALAADGVVFERAYAHAPQTLPAHAALLTGRLPHEIGVRDDAGGHFADDAGLVSSRLSARGYATGGIVSSFALRRGTGVSQGFSYFDDDLARGEPNPEPGASGDLEPRNPTVRRPGSESVRLAERWLSASGTARAFLFLHLDLPAGGTALSRPAGPIADADAAIADLVAYLRKQQLYDESTIIVVGAHATALQDRVPLIIKLAGGEGAGRRVPDVVQHVDLAPTILDLARAPIPAGLTGRSLRPLLEGRALPGRPAYAESLFSALHYGAAPLRTVVDGGWRLMDGATRTLFDLAADPDATVDVAAAHPDRVSRLAALLAEIGGTLDVPEVMSARDLPPADRVGFLALGALGPGSMAAGLVPARAQAPDDGLVAAFTAATREAAAGRWAPSLDGVRALARRHPDRLDLWAALGLLGEWSDRADVSAEAFRRVVSAVPDAHEARVRLASALARARRLDDARQQAELAGAADVAAVRVVAHEVLARVALARHDPGAARVHAQHLIDEAPTAALPAAIEGRLLIDRGRFDEALEWLDRAAGQAERTPTRDVHLWRGEALAKLDRPDEAEEAFRAELLAFPRSVGAHAALATLYHAGGRFDEARQMVVRMGGLQTPESLDAAARLWASFGDLANADAARAESQRLQPGRRVQASAQ